MDRLVCGDVGFGKTEVAIRAIFKAITAGKQVAMLPPNGAGLWHWRTLDRLAPYPIKVALSIVSEQHRTQNHSRYRSWNHRRRGGTHHCSQRAISRAWSVGGG